MMTRTQQSTVTTGHFRLVAKTLRFQENHNFNVVFMWQPEGYNSFSIRRLGLSSELSNETSLRGVVKFEHPKNVYGTGAP